MRLSLLILALVGWALVTPSDSAPQTRAPRPSADDPDADREAKVVERFVGLLEKTPKRGTSLDRVYGYHVERGSLETLVGRYRDRTANDPKDGASWMILGLVEAQRGRDALAVTAFRQAETSRPDDPLASYYLGQSLVLVGQPDEAVKAFERALTRKPQRAEVLEISQALGKVHQRARRNDQALAVWERLEQQFPDDPRVIEQIAATLTEEGQSALALPRYEALATKARDPYRKIQYRIEAADIKVRLGQRPQALTDFEALLGSLNPDSWLFQEVRRKIEEVFLRSDDQAGLATYYENWIKAHPEDVDSIARRARVLATLGRAAEAREALERAVKLAPSRRELRLALVEQLVAEKKFADAAAQYEGLSKAEPKNPDNLREWGRLLLRDTARPEAERKAAAAAVWRKLLDSRPKDPAIAAQVADLFRKAEMTDEAIALYQKAIALAPDASQYREYLGEYYHTLKRNNEALATWNASAEGPNHNAANLGRLAEVLSGFGYKQEAETASAAAVALDGKSFDLRLKHADLLGQLERFDDALAELDRTEPLADDPEQAEAVLTAQIRNLQAGGKLAARIEALQRALEAGDNASAERYRRLARYQEAAQKLPEALAAVRRAIAIDPKAVPSLVALARIEEASGDLGASAEALRMLAAIDRRARSEHLTAIARLEARLGRREQAMQAGRDLLAAAPNNPEHYQFFAELCFGLGDVEEGLKALRRAAQINESDPKAALTLAEALATQFRTEEAIELYWRGFDKTNELDAKVGIIAKLAPLYLQQNQFDRLTARIERAFSEGDAQRQPREKAACLAQAYTASGDYTAARQQLESLLATNPRDTQLLQQLSSLAETEGDVSGAARYQKQINDVAPSFDGTTRLAQLHLRAGETAEAEALWASLANDEQEAHRVLQAIDSLLTAGRNDVVPSITEKLLRRDPGNWDTLYREGVALVALDQTDEADRRFRAILAQRGDDDQPGQVEKARRKSASNRPAGARASSLSNPLTVPIPLQSRLSASFELRRITGIDPQYAQIYLVNPGTRVWTPSDAGQARMGALAWLINLAARQDKLDDVVAEFRDAATAPNADLRTLWDWYYLNSVRGESQETYRAALLLARAAPASPEAQWALLSSVAARARSNSLGATRVASRDRDRTPPLPDGELDTLVAAYESLRARKSDWASGVPQSALMTELRRARRKDLEDQLYRETVESAQDFTSLNAALTQAAERTDVPRLLALAERADRVTANRLNAISTFIGIAFGKAMANLADQKRHAEILPLLDAQLDGVRKPERAAQRVKQTAASTAPAPRYTLNLGGNRSSFVQIDFPPPNLYLDGLAIQTLRNAFELYRRDDRLSDLFAYMTKRWKDKEAGDPVYELLALAALRWWNDQKDEAIQELTAAVAASSENPELKLALAELRAVRNEPAEALALVDTIEPPDQKLMQRRELLALRLAVLAGDLARARQAAERLFGLRLDANTQVQLATQMHQLGMHELAEAVLGRARRRAGNDPATLVSLMLQYQRQDKLDQALQVAYQILRRTPQRSNAMGIVDQSDAYQQQALQVLARSGKLDEQIARVEAQIKHAPGSVGLYQMLATYYGAAGQRDKVKEVHQRLLKVRPDDAKLRLQLAQQATRENDTDSALGHYLAVLKKEPGLIGPRVYEVWNVVRQAERQAEFAQTLNALDARTLGAGGSNLLFNFAQVMTQDAETLDLGLELFRKAWKAFPSQRASWLRNAWREEFGRLPEVFDYTRQAVLPQPAQGPPDPWNLFNQMINLKADGRIDMIETRLVEVAERQNQLEELAEDLTKAVERFPGWSSGKALLALVRYRQGRPDEGTRLLRPLMDDRDDPLPAATAQILGQELEDDPTLEALALALFEHAMARPSRDSGLPQQYDFSATKRLVGLHQRASRPEQARALILKASSQEDEADFNRDPQFSAYLRVNAALERGQALTSLGYPADAIRLNNAILANPNLLQTASQIYGGGSQLSDQLRQNLERALASLKGDALARALRSLLKPEGTAAPYDQALDLLVLIQPRDLRAGKITSLTGEAIQTAEKSPKLLGEARSTLAELARDKPDDLSVLIASALTMLTGGEASTIEPALERLRQHLEAHPLEALPTGARANARQREAAAPRLALWPVARACWQRESSRITAGLFAEQAKEAARRQADPLWLQVLLREWGELALERGDRKAAEEAWAALLDQILIQPAPKASGATTSALAAPAVVASAAVPVAATTTVRAIRLQPAVATSLTARVAQFTPTAAGTTLDRFGQAAEVARLAAENGMTALSLRALRESLRGGPPIDPIALDPNVSMTRVVRSGLSPFDTDTRGGNLAHVESRIAELDRLWTRRQAPAADVYDTLRQIVFLEARPQEIFPYPRPLFSGPVERPSSVGAILVRWALKAGQADTLAQLLETRQEQPMAALPAQVMRVQLALARGDQETARQGLETLVQRLKKDSLPTTAELACHAAIPALDQPACAASAEAVAAQALQSLTPPGNARLESASLALLLIRHDFRMGKLDEARARLREYQANSERARQSPNSPGLPIHSSLSRIVIEYVRAEQWADALTALGDYADARPMPNEQTIGLPLARVAKHLRERPAAERYQTLKDWALPDNAGKPVRLLAAVVTTDSAPATLGARTWSDPSGLVSMPELLIAAARETGTLDDLAAAADRAVARSAENAEVLQSLVWIAQGKAEEVWPLLARALERQGKDAADRLREAKARASMAGAAISFNPRSGPKASPWPDALLALACLNAPALRDDARRLIEFLNGEDRQGWLADLLAARLLAGQAGAQPPIDPGLRHWTPWHNLFARRYQVGPVAGRWVAHDGHVRRVIGLGMDSLAFAYPLKGRYTVTVETRASGTGAGGLRHDGWLIRPVANLNQFDPIRNTNRVTSGLVFSTMSSVERLERAATFLAPERFNTLTIEVAPEQTRYLLNGQLIAEAPGQPGGISRLGLYAGGPSEFRGFRMSGNPEIPREIRLVVGDDLRGWSAAFQGDSIRPRAAALAALDDDSDSGAFKPKAYSDQRDGFAWEARDGVILSHRPEPLTESTSDQPAESLLASSWPLRDGETLTYEFMYEPDAVMVHPALGRLAFLIGPKGVQTHWITDGEELDPSGLTADNAIDDPATQPGDGPPALKPGDWNALTMSLQEGRVTLTLNGAMIASRAVEPENSRLFGLFHFKDRTAVKVRNVVLRGDWPATLPADLFEFRAAPTAEERRLRHAWIGETSFGRDADLVLRETTALPADQRVERLAAWVLPGDDHPTVRLQGRFRPTDAASSGTDRVGTIDAPALALVAAAREAGSLDRLEQRLQAIEPATELDRRGLLALRVAVATASGQTERAQAALQQLTALTAAVPLDRPLAERWPELVALTAVLPETAVLPSARPLAEALASQARRFSVGMVPFEGQDAWIAHVLHLRAWCERGESDPWPSRWLATSRFTAESRGQGLPPASWIVREGAIEHLPGHRDDALYLAAPIRGDFELTAELRGLGPDQVRLSYGGIAVVIDGDGKTATVNQPGRNDRKLPIEPPLDPIGPIPYRLAIKGNSYEVTLGDRQVIAEVLTRGAEPWLVLKQAATGRGSIRGLRLAGRPETPAQVPLGGRPDLSIWHSYRDEPPRLARGQDPAWSRRGVEIVGRALPIRFRAAEQRTLFLDRPLGDGETVTYEFRHEPGKVMVHPALDRQVFLVEPEGVRQLRLSDAPFDTSTAELPALKPRAESERPALQAGEWNTMALSLKGDTITLALNGATIAEATIAPGSARTFGFFHDAGQTEARVRNVVLSGDWSRALPPGGDLAAPNPKTK